MDKLCQDETDKQWNKMKEQWDKEEVYINYLTYRRLLKLIY